MAKYRKHQILPKSNKKNARKPSDSHVAHLGAQDCSLDAQANMNAGGGLQPTRERFWEEKSLDEMNAQEWEALCDGCGRCCLVILRDEDSDQLHETDVACRLYDQENRKCCDYENRRKRVPDCVTLTPQKARALDWMPETCAYRRLGNGLDLLPWHPLISGTRQSVINAGISTPLGLISEEDISDEDLPERVRGQRK